MSELVTSQIVKGILECDPQAKQRLGQRFAKHLRLKEGVSGRDDGVDGIAEHDGNKILFQSKLRGTNIGPDDVKIFVADLIRHEANIGIYLAGVGFTEECNNVAQQLNRIICDLWRKDCQLFFVTLRDIFEQTELLQDVEKVLPSMWSLNECFTRGNLR